MGRVLREEPPWGSQGLCFLCDGKLILDAFLDWLDTVGKSWFLGKKDFDLEKLINMI